MTEEILQKANEIQKEIKDLNKFISNAEMLWTGKLVIRKPKLFFKTNSYGAVTGEEFGLDNEMKDEVLDLLKTKRDNLLKELEKLN